MTAIPASFSKGCAVGCLQRGFIGVPLVTSMRPLMVAAACLGAMLPQRLCHADMVLASVNLYGEVLITADAYRYPPQTLSDSVTTGEFGDADGIYLRGVGRDNNLYGSHLSLARDPASRAD
jgi:hypothetical protein